MTNHLSSAVTARDMMVVAHTHGLGVAALGGDKLWVHAEKGTVISGRVLAREEREKLDKQTGEVRVSFDYMIQLLSVPEGQRVLIRGSSDPRKEDGRELLALESDGVTRAYALAQKEDIVYLTENYRTKCLSEHIGEIVLVKYITKKAISGGRKVWEIAVQFLPGSAGVDVTVPPSVTLAAIPAHTPRS